MPLHMLVDPATVPETDPLAARVRESGGRILSPSGNGSGRYGESVVASGFPPDDIFVVLPDPSELEFAKAARIRACAIEPDPSRTSSWFGVDELWPDIFAAMRWLDRQLQLETRGWPIATVGGLVFRDDGKAFFVRTAKWNGTWGVPGGKIEYGEPSVAAFVREIREETGLEVDDVRFVVVQDAIEEPEFHRPRHFLLLNYTARATKAAIRLNHESLEGGWFSLPEALDLPLNRPTRALVERVLGLPNLPL